MTGKKSPRCRGQGFAQTSIDLKKKKCFNGEEALGTEVNSEVWSGGSEKGKGERKRGRGRKEEEEGIASLGWGGVGDGALL